MCTARVMQVANVATLFRRDEKAEKRGNLLCSYEQKGELKKS